MYNFSSKRLATIFLFVMFLMIFVLGKGPSDDLLAAGERRIRQTTACNPCRWQNLFLWWPISYLRLLILEVVRGCFIINDQCFLGSHLNRASLQTT